MMRAVGVLFRPLGWQLRPVDPPLDLRGLTDDPVHGLYLSGGKPFVVEVPLKRARGLVNFAFPCTQASGDPYVATVAAYLRGECASYRGSPMEAFYSAWKPRDAAEAVGLAGRQAPLRRLAPHFIVLPWGRLSPGEEVARSSAIARKQNSSNGRPDLGMEHGTLTFGLSQEKGQLEFERLRRIADSMRADGFRRSGGGDGDVSGYLLIDGAGWAVSVRLGVHRTAVATALGMERLPMRIGLVDAAWSAAGVRRSEVRCWPNVRNGLFSEAQALAVFDRVFQGRQPQGCPRPETASAALDGAAGAATRGARTLLRDRPVAGGTSP